MFRQTINLFFFSMIGLFSSAQPVLKYNNPILSGFYPDPSICKVNDDYYLVNSSFAYFPGLPIFHSKDLVNWIQIGHAMDRKEQLDLKNAGVSRGLFAPTIRYHNGFFYIVCTLIDKKGNFVITAKDPKGPWSNPTWLPVDGIDPSLYFDDNKSYLLFNSIPPDNKSLYGGHRTIRMIEFDAINLKLIGKEKIIINGGTDINKKPVWIEGPHILKKNGWYYLLCAEGGTGYNHSEVVFRSKQVEGPYISYEKNPILTQRELDPNRQNPITTTGHADIVEGMAGEWHAVFLGCRPYGDDHYNTGRETFMAPIKWVNDWPVINPEFAEVQYAYPVPFVDKTKLIDNKFNGNFLFQDDFKAGKLNARWVFLRAPEEDWYKIRQGRIEMNLLPQTCSGKNNPAFVGFRQPHLNGYASTSLDFKTMLDNEKAGLLVFQNEDHFYYLCKSFQDDKPVVQLYKSISGDTTGKMELMKSEQLHAPNSALYLKTIASGSIYSFYYSEKKGKWNLLADNIDARFLSTKTAGGFVGTMYALYATSAGEATFNSASFDFFQCKTDEPVYK